ncbi:MAG TPA: DUF4188 domain-containing protein [Polyangiaceae bacterium]|jgi:hypothetical protein|nr:DUF4188 domain-containing protein [Polyangiaceae bacterium]
MEKPIPERMTVDRSEGVVVFLIGMRVNRWWKIHRWLPVMLAMPRMLRELRAKPESGYLGGILQPGLSVQYWSSIDALLAYAADRSGEHFPAWAAFSRKVGTSGDVGIWHETYVVPAGGVEAVYVNMPPTGLGRFAPLVPARGSRARARTRLNPRLAEVA